MSRELASMLVVYLASCSPGCAGDELIVAPTPELPSAKALVVASIDSEGGARAFVYSMDAVAPIRLEYGEGEGTVAVEAALLGRTLEERSLSPGPLPPATDALGPRLLDDSSLEILGLLELKLDVEHGTGAWRALTSQSQSRALSSIRLPGAGSSPCTALDLVELPISSRGLGFLVPDLDPNRVLAGYNGPSGGALYRVSRDEVAWLGDLPGRISELLDADGILAGPAAPASLTPDGRLVVAGAGVLWRLRVTPTELLLEESTPFAYGVDAVLLSRFDDTIYVVANQALLRVRDGETELLFQGTTVSAPGCNDAALAEEPDGTILATLRCFVPASGTPSIVAFSNDRVSFRALEGSLYTPNIVRTVPGIGVVVGVTRDGGIFIDRGGGLESFRNQTGNTVTEILPVPDGFVVITVDDRAGQFSAQRYIDGFGLCDLEYAPVGCRVGQFCRFYYGAPLGQGVVLGGRRGDGLYYLLPRATP